MKIPLGEIKTALLTGELDDIIPDILKAITVRKQMINDRTRCELRGGQSIWFTDITRPRYLVGAEATVVQVNRERIVVDLKRPCGRFSGRLHGVSLNLVTTTKPIYAKD